MVDLLRIPLPFKKWLQELTGRNHSTTQLITSEVDLLLRYAAIQGWGSALWAEC